jgi:hypothetical protein
MESPFLNAVVMIATGAAVIKFALFEWEGIVHAWIRVTRLRRRKQPVRGRPR